MIPPNYTSRSQVGCRNYRVDRSLRIRRGLDSLGQPTERYDSDRMIPFTLVQKAKYRKILLVVVERVELRTVAARECEDDD